MLAKDPTRLIPYTDMVCLIRRDKRRISVDPQATKSKMRYARPDTADAAHRERGPENREIEDCERGAQARDAVDQL